MASTEEYITDSLNTFGLSGTGPAIRPEYLPKISSSFEVIFASVLDPTGTFTAELRWREEIGRSDGTTRVTGTGNSGRLWAIPGGDWSAVPGGTGQLYRSSCQGLAVSE